MRIHLRQLEVVTRKTTELVKFSPVTFVHGPVGSGKSTTARLVDFCFGGELVDTPALQQEFLAARLFAVIGDHEVALQRERSSESAVRVTWQRIAEGEDTVSAPESILAPLEATKGLALLEGAEDVENLSDLLFHLAGVRPIRVRRSKRDPDSPLVRLSFRDLFFYCYLDQDNLDSSFFSFEHPFKRQKSIDALRFVVGFHSEKLNALEQRLYRAVDEQRSKRTAAEQLARVLKDLELDNELQIAAELQKIGMEKSASQSRLADIEKARSASSHPLDSLRASLRALHRKLSDEERALANLREKVSSQESLRAELLTAKVKATRADAARHVLAAVEFKHCPQCETPLSEERFNRDHCSLCGQIPLSNVGFEQLASEFDLRADEIGNLVARQKAELEAQQVRVSALSEEKEKLDKRLSDEAQRYDASFLAELRALERKIASLAERERGLHNLRRLPATLDTFIRHANDLQGEIDAARKGIEQETERLKHAQNVVQNLADRFRHLLLRVGFPGMSEKHFVRIDTPSWEPRVEDGTLGWGFGDLGSGGKKVLFKVLYALAIHELAAAFHLPLPTVLIVDSPTKNISHDVNPELFEAFYREVYRVAHEYGASRQFILIDSALIAPPSELAPLFTQRLLDHSDDAPPLISYYRGP